MSTTIIRAAALALLLASSACTYSQYDLPHQVNSYNASIEQLEEQAILVNILRASENAPLGFTQIAVVRGSGTLMYQAGLPTITLGGPQATLQRELMFGPNALSPSANTNFDLSVLETKEFWLGMLTPISPDTLAFFINQGVPREVLFYLYVQHVQLSSAGKSPEIENNNPSDPHFANFSDDLGVALSLGLTADTATRTLDFGPPLPSSQAADVTNLVNIAKAGLNIVPVESKSGVNYQLQATRSAAVICFDQARATVDISQRLPKSVNCASMRGESAPPASPAGTPFAYQEAAAGTRPSLNIAIYPRSTYDIFRYLGALVRASQETPPRSVHLATEEAKFFGGSEPLADDLFVVRKNARGASFVSVKYGKDTYSIPKTATTTIEVLALLRQLIALSTSVNSLPPTGSVTTVVH